MKLCLSVVGLESRAVVDLASPLFCLDNLGLSVSSRKPALLPRRLR